LPTFQKTRVRPRAQNVTPEYIEKYKKAIEIMRGLNDSDPHSWTQQAKIHCAYCGGAYTQGNNTDSSYRIQVHGCSLFFPFHRWYLYFHERILGKLLGDETFALPYWNWDNPDGGMMMPAIYDDSNSPLFDKYRDDKHRPQTIVDLKYCDEDRNNTDDLIHQNLCIMKKQMIDNAPTAEYFFGRDPSAPNPYPNEPLYLTNYSQQNAGSIEWSVHNSVHDWTGDPMLPNHEDMGIIYSAAYDPIFYAHHANVDRMWTIWKDLDPKHKEPESSDWLNASYVFYDENKELVRVYHKDCVDTIKMGYEFEESPIPWNDTRSVPRHKKKKLECGEDTKFPVKLNKVVKVNVMRPFNNRSDEDKENAKEMLFLNGIKYDSSVYLAFDVLVNAFDDTIETTACDSEFAGSYAELAQPHGEKFKTSGAVFGITQLLEDVKAEHDDCVLVSLVPRAGSDVTISEIKIELVPIDD
jgi:polyphenol oxidase